MSHIRFEVILLKEYSMAWAMYFFLIKINKFPLFKTEEFNARAIFKIGINFQAY